MTRRALASIALIAALTSCVDTAGSDSAKVIVHPDPPVPTTGATPEPDPEPEPEPEPIPEPTSPLTGLSAEPELLERRVLAVKIDNSQRARPQSGLHEADAVVEFPLRGGLTRLMALFHVTDSEYVGPIRSLRPSDIEVATALDATIVVSGGQPWILELAAAHDVGLVGETTGTFRIGGRFAPHNLYGSTLDLRRTADDFGHPDEPPQPWLPFGDWGAGTRPATALTLRWSTRDTVEWRFDRDHGTYRRWMNRAEHAWVDTHGATGQITTDVVVVLGTRIYSAASQTGLCCHAVPAVATVGSGPAWVVAHGMVWTGTWQRESLLDPFVLLDGDGSPATVPPGRPWLTFVPEDRPVMVE
jgi:hypothetical protein